MSAPRRAGLLLVGCALAALLVGCGKRAPLEPPEGLESSYTYPRQYPNPATVLPGKAKTSETPEAEAPPHAGGLSPFPASDGTTVIYRSPPP